MVRRRKVSNWPETTAALGRRDGRRRRFYQSTESGASRRSQNQGGGAGGTSRELESQKQGLLVGERRLLGREVATVKDLTRREKEGKLSQPFPSSCSPAICLPLAKLT